MLGFDQPTKAQLMESCNAVESVLDSLRNHTSTSLTNRSRIISPVKALFTSLQRLEEDEVKLDGAFHTTDARARHNLAGVLTSCGVVAGQLRKRINSNALRHDDGLGIELMTLTAEIEKFMKLGKKKATARPKPGTTSESSALVEDLLRKQQKHESEVEGLEDELHVLYARERTFEQEIATLGAELTAKDKLISGLEDYNDAKLSHIRRLHAAISNLGLRHPMNHQTHDWDDLTDELPAMVQRIENINLKLKELELERDRLKDQEHDSEEDMVPSVMPSVPKPPLAANGLKIPTREKDKDGKRKHRRPTDDKTTSKVRSPSPTSSEASKANTSKSVRRKSRSVNTGSGFFFGK